MDSALKISSSFTTLLPNSSSFSSSSSSSSFSPCNFHKNSSFTVPEPTHRLPIIKVAACSPQDASRAVGEAHRRRSSLESLFCYDKAIPEEIIEKPVGISLSEKNIGDKIKCPDCQAKGAVLCATCSGSGLYIDSILESQGIIVKVRCLGCGGTGNVMCSDCGGRGHVSFA